MTHLVAVVGPTAAGKTELAIRIALAAGAEIVSADSQQVYRGIDIGTAKPTTAERARVPHHLVDVAAPDEPMTAARFMTLADAAIQDCAARRVPVVVAGGTGLYYRALIYGIFAGPPADAELRARFAATPLSELRERLEREDPAAAAKIEKNDRIRTTRALEVLEQTGIPISAQQQQFAAGGPPRYEVRGIGLDPPRAELTARIDARVERMIAAGLVEEVRGLAAAGYSLVPGKVRAFSAIGYREIAAHLRGELTLDDAMRKIQQATRQYARRQRAWFRSEPTVTWYTSPGDVEVAELAAWLRAELPPP